MTDERDKGTWLEGLNRWQRLAAYGEWVDSKVQDGDNEAPLSFDAWLEMERSMAEPPISRQ